MSTSTPVLEIQQLTKHYGGVKALTDAQFRLLPGEHAAIVGDNGAGKSTLVKIISGGLQPTSGQMLFEGDEFQAKTPAEAKARPTAFAAPNLPQALDAALTLALQGAAGLAAGAVLVAVTYDTGARGHLMALVGASPAAEPALARAVAEALAFAGLEAAALDVTFLAPEDPALRTMAAVGRAFAIAAPQPAELPPMPAAPGTAPSQTVPRASHWQALTTAFADPQQCLRGPSSEAAQETRLA